VPAPARRASWAGVPLAERRAERRAALVAAGFELLGGEGWSGLTVRGVCARARLNPRYFYESFEDLDGLAVAVYDQVLAEPGAAIRQAQAAASRSARAQLAATVDSTVGFIDDDRRRGRVLYVEALGSEALNRRRLEAGHELVELLGREAASGSDGEAAAQAARLGAAVLVGGFTELLVAWLDGRIRVAREVLVEDATTLLLRLADASATVVESRSDAGAVRRVGMPR
jgi:AcrR family transcriptional regulator